VLRTKSPLKGLVGPDHTGPVVVGGGDHMAMSVNEIAQQSNAVFDQIGNYPISWVAASIGIAVVGFWLFAEVVEFFEDRKRQRLRFARPLA
jgi:hypothetical protein